MEVKWTENNIRYKQLYWMENCSLEDFERYSTDCDCLIIWYSHNIDERIYEEYKELMWFTEINGYWKGRNGSRIIDLTLSAEDILEGFSKNRKYKTKRALNRDNLKLEYVNEYSKEVVHEFEQFYNQFARQKKLPLLDTIKVDAMMRNHQFAITKIRNREDEVLVINGYVVDQGLKRVSMYSSNSLYREKKELSALIGRANSLLHYMSMLFFKNKGYKEYDLGGVYLGKEEGVSKDYINVRDFKTSLGGSLVEFENGFGVPVSEIRNIKNNLLNFWKMIEKGKVVLWGWGSYGKYIDRILRIKGIIPVYIIDNELYKNDEMINCQEILNTCSENDTVILITTGLENYKKIIREEVCAKFVKKDKILFMRG